MTTVKYKLGLVGCPLKHSLSSLLFREIALRENLPLRYTSWEISPAYSEEFFHWLKRSEITGINVTIPYKERIMDHLDQLDETARIIGAVNVVKKFGDELHGYNTDWYGFVESLKRARVQPSKMLIFGGGGAARAVLYAALAMNCQAVTVAERSEARAVKLKQAFSSFLELKVISWESSLLAVEIEEADLVVNATPVGLPNWSGSFPLETSFLGSGKLFFDLIYKPEVTPFMKIGLCCGARAINGLDMLLFQAMKSLEIWTGIETSYQKWQEAYQKIQGVKLAN
jgi:shikimate dehydrogenase